MKKYFVMSDIHSFYNEMIAALKLKHFDDANPDHHIVICGDLFDRGPDAVKCFEFVKKMADADRLMYIYGNHEELLQECVEEICTKRGVSPHHISNGTLDTLVQFTGMSKYDLCAGWVNTKEFIEKINPVLEFIYDQSVDCGVFGDYIFVHGWIPCDPHSGKVEENWNTPDANWSVARWINGMSAWHKGARIQGKTIVCGHWNTSWGHSHLRQDRKEFPAKNRVDWEKSFVPFIDEGIIALDACTAYTGFCNCVVLEKI